MDLNDPRTTVAIDDLLRGAYEASGMCRAPLRSACPPWRWAGFRASK